MRVSAIVPSAGNSSRIRSNMDKPFIRLCGKEIIRYALRALQDSSLISEIIIASKDRNIARFKSLIKKEGFTKVTRIVRGGKKRCESVLKALLKVDKNSDFVLIHDAARPFITQALIKKTVAQAKIYGASLSAVLVKPTIKKSDSRGSLVKKTLNRELLWEAQTPQVIRKDLFLKAYNKAGKSHIDFTDDVSLVERLSKRVKIVAGNYDNIKITTPEDLDMAEAILKAKNSKRKA